MIKINTKDSRYFCNSCQLEHESIPVITARLYLEKPKPKYYEQEIARRKLRWLIRKGDIIKLPCEVCEELKVEAHHYLGYEGEHYKDVQFLCMKHHKEKHKTYI